MKLLLIDGHYYVYRSFFAIRELSNSRGEATNAIYGFVKTVRRMLKDLQPDLAAVIWDMGIPKRRSDLQPEYKQQRDEMPDLMRPQLGLIQDLVPLMGLPSLGLEDTEADDLMASYTVAACERGYEVVLATNDKDLFQLVNEKVKVYSTLKTDLLSPKDTHVLLGAETVRRKWGVEPGQIGEILSLVGDSADNIPGVSGLGPKGAAALIQAHGSLKSILENFDQVKNERIREKLRAAEEQIRQNQEMVRLDLDLPLPVPVEQLKIAPQYPAYLAQLANCEFKSLLAEVTVESERAVPASQGELF